MMERPTIGIMLGDRNGIGPELVGKLLAEREATLGAEITVVADPAVFERGIAVANRGLPRDLRPRFIERRAAGKEPIGTGKVSAAAGAEVLDHLGFMLELFQEGEIDGIVFAPLNKQAMRQGGLPEGDELDFVVERLGFSGNCGELNVLGNLWTSRVTSHVALKDVAPLITKPRVLDAIHLAHETLSAAGVARPRLAVAGLNPHAGDGGTFGDEEIKEIGPAIAAAKAAGIDATGPYPSDTVFVGAKDGRFDAVVTMYHDQGQVAMKLMGFGRGVTVLGGIPAPIATAGHGTAYDIVGQGVAKPDGLIEAFRICRAMASARRAARQAAQ
jgi:4-hydroxythreonine-4-phosphate dehydrogenase